jgi:hypothetical protein
MFVTAWSPSAPREKRYLWELVTRFLLTQATQHSMLVIVEDLHWGDEESLDLLYYLARRSTTSSVLLVLSYRSDAATPHLQQLLVSLNRERLAQEQHLSSLPPGAVELMIQTILALPAASLSELLYAVYPLCEGNPFFLGSTSGPIRPGSTDTFAGSMCSRSATGKSWRTSPMSKDSLLARQWPGGQPDLAAHRWFTGYVVKGASL